MTNLILIVIPVFGMGAVFGWAVRDWQGQRLPKAMRTGRPVWQRVEQDADGVPGRRWWSDDPTVDVAKVKWRRDRG